MKKAKKIIAISFILILPAALLFLWQSRSYSADPQQEAIKYCEAANNDSCGRSYCKLMAVAEQGWLQNLDQMTKQEKPASAMVDDAVQNLRTYQCWLEYICEAVAYSGSAGLGATKGTGITGNHIAQIAGCQNPEDETFPPGWENMLKHIYSLNIIPINEVINNPLQYKKLNLIPQCMTNPPDNTSPSPQAIAQNYASCEKALELRFANCAPDENLGKCSKRSGAMVALQGALKQANASQKSRVLENKLAGIVQRMAGMEEHANYMVQKFQEFKSLTQCVAKKCGP